METVTANQHRSMNRASVVLSHNPSSDNGAARRVARIAGAIRETGLPDVDALRIGTTALERSMDDWHGDTSPTGSSIFLMVTRNKTLDSMLLGEEHCASASSATPAAASTSTEAAPAARSAPGTGMVWVNTDSGIYHKEGSRYLRQNE